MKDTLLAASCLFALTLECAAQGFTDVAAQAGVGFADLNTAEIAWADYDGDGDEDFFMGINGGSYQPNDVLARNNGDGTFTEVAQQAGVQGPAPLSFQHGSAWADYDRDGDLDLFVATTGGAPHALYRNEGNGTFTDVAQAAGIAPLWVGARAGIWADVDADGWNDLFLPIWNLPNQLFHNHGDGTFGEIAQAAGVAGGDHATSSACFGDYDGDGDPDLYVCSVSSNGPSALYRNNGDLTFSDVTAAAGLASVRAFAAVWADLDGDLDLDLYVHDVVTGGWTGLHYANQGDGTFADVGSGSGLRFWQPSGFINRAPSVGDYDNDGDLDVYITRSLTSSGSPPVPNIMLRNDGGVFTDVSAPTGTDDGHFAEGSAWADYDGDGDLDLYVANDWPDACLLYRNDLGPSHWVRLRLVGGASSSSDAIGARVRLLAGGLWQLREVSGGGTGGNCQESLPLEFGLGAATQVDELWVEWPGGALDAWVDLGGDREHLLAEGGGVPCIDPLRYCVAAPNSAGPGALIDSSGPPSVSANAFTLTVAGGPPVQPALFFYGPAQNQIPFYDGYLCVGAGGLGLFRLAPALVLDGTGAGARWLDLAAPPANAGPGRIALGSTWYFQVWYRDPAAGGTGANLSDGLRVSFCP